MREGFKLFWKSDLPPAAGDWVFLCITVIISVGLILCVIRLLKGPSLADRVVALDLISALMMVVFMDFALFFGTEVYLSVALAIAVVGFLATVSISRYMEVEDADDE